MKEQLSLNVLYFSNMEKNVAEIKLITIRIEFLITAAWFMGLVTLFLANNYPPGTH